MKNFTNYARKFFAIVLAALLVSVVLAPIGAVAATATADSKISEYVCDFEGNYGKTVPGEIAEANGSEALNFIVASSKSTHRFEINNSSSGDFTLNHGSVYAVTISYKVDQISAEVQSEIMTTINLVRYNGNSDTLVKIKTFSGAAFVPGDTTGWVKATVVFKASIADSPEFNRLAINVVSPSCPSTETKVEDNMTSIWFDDIVVTECNGNTATYEFTTNGGSHCEVLMAQPGETVTLPTPTRDLYDFAGWYKDSDLTNKLESDKMPASLITKLYAKWEVSASSIKVEFVDAHDENVKMLVGRAGDALTLPTPVRRDFHFAGWYLDEELKTKCNYTTFPNESVVLYAKWEIVPFFCGFENKADYGTPNDSTLTKRCDVLETDPLRGKYSIYYNYWNGSQTEKPTQWRAAAGVMLINEHGEKFQAEPGATYTITFNYKVNKVDIKNKGNKEGSFGIILSSTGGAWSNRMVVAQAYDKKESFIYTKKDIEKGWQQGTLTFVSTPKANSLDNAFVTLGIAGDSEILVDDVCVYRVDEKFTYDGKCVINFDSQGGNYCETVKGEFGETIAMPADPVREGYRFMGWYTDPEGNNLFDTEGAVYEYGYLKLYADWFLIPAEKPVEEEIVVTEPEEDPKNNTLLYIIIAAAVVLVAVVAVVVVASKKKKPKTEKTDK